MFFLRSHYFLDKSILFALINPSDVKKISVDNKVGNSIYCLKPCRIWDIKAHDQIFLQRKNQQQQDWLCFALKENSSWFWIFVFQTMYKCFPSKDSLQSSFPSKFWQSFNMAFIRCHFSAEECLKLFCSDWPSWFWTMDDGERIKLSLDWHNWSILKVVKTIFFQSMICQTTCYSICRQITNVIFWYSLDLGSVDALSKLQ